MPGAYGEAAALKAYPNCETVPCEKYEKAFKVLIINIFLVFSCCMNLCRNDYIIQFHSFNRQLNFG